MTGRPGNTTATESLNQAFLSLIAGQAHEIIKIFQDHVAVDSLGNMIVVGVRGVSGCSGCLNNNLDWHVRKDHATGTLLWEDTYSGAANLYDYAYRVAVDSENNPIVVGYTKKGNDNSTNANYDWIMIKYAADGVSGAGQRL